MDHLGIMASRGAVLLLGGMLPAGMARKEIRVMLSDNECRIRVRKSYFLSQKLWITSATA